MKGDNTQGTFREVTVLYGTVIMAICHYVCAKSLRLYLTNSAQPYGP